MTEAEWLTSTRLYLMWETIPELIRRQKKTWWDRKYRLFGCACFRAIWDVLPDEVLHAAVVTAEKYADGKADNTDLKEASDAIVRQSHWLKSVYVEGCIQLLRRTARTAAESHSNSSRWEKANPRLSKTEQEQEQRTQQSRLAVQREMLRDIFGNPFRPVAFSPEWRTDTAIALARTMYESREFSAMPILADALQDAGCDNTDILAHCRDPKQVHVRGCWVVDLVLGRT
jgi:hypothetical protein